MLTTASVCVVDSLVFATTNYQLSEFYMVVFQAEFPVFSFD